MIPNISVLDLTWRDISPPTGWGGWYPFVIQQKARQFRPHPSFNLLSYANIPAGTTYYVSKSGDDAHGGLSWGDALRNVYTALGKADAAKIYVGSGYWYRNEAVSGTAPARSLALIGVGDVTLTSDCYNQINAFSKVGNHYEATTARTMRQVYDGKYTDTFGDDLKLTLRISAAEVDANINSWYLAAGTFYIRLIDDRPPDTFIHALEQGSTLPPLYNAGAKGPDKTVYVENIKARGGSAIGVIYQVSGDIFKYYLYNVDMKYADNYVSSTYNAFTVWGATEFIAWNAILGHSPLYDGFSYKPFGGITPKAVEINVNSFDHGDDGIDQPSTTHQGVEIIRIMGKYHDCRGITILAEAGTPGGKTWDLGSELFNPGAGGNGKYVDTGVNAWLDCCNIYNVPNYALQVADAASAIRHRNLISNGNFYNNGGILTTY